MGAKVADVMTARPRAVTPQTPLNEVAEVMRSDDVGSVPVVEGDRLVGIVTDRDIVVRAIAQGKDPRGMPASEVSTRELVTVGPDDDLGCAKAHGAASGQAPGSDRRGRAPRGRGLPGGRGPGSEGKGHGRGRAEHFASATGTAYALTFSDTSRTCGALRRLAAASGRLEVRAVAGLPGRSLHS